MAFFGKGCRLVVLIVESKMFLWYLVSSWPTLSDIVASHTTKLAVWSFSASPYHTLELRMLASSFVLIKAPKTADN